MLENLKTSSVDIFEIERTNGKHVIQTFEKEGNAIKLNSSIKINFSLNC